MNKNYIKAIKNLEPSSRELTIRQIKVCSYRWGIDDGKEHTLEETGKVFGATREGIRFIILKSMEKMREIDKALDKDL